MKADKSMQLRSELYNHEVSFEKGANSVHARQYHFVQAVKYRKPVLESVGLVTF